MLTVLTDKNEIDAAQNKLLKQLRQEATRKGPVELGHQGGSVSAQGLWFKDLNFWFAYTPMPQGERHWNAFGHDVPFDKTVNIEVEANPPFHGIKRNIAGAFARDEDGDVYLVHRGMIHGRKGIGKHAFLKNYEGILEPMIDGDRQTPVIIIGAVGSHSFLAQLDHFTRVVAEFKAQIAGPASGQSTAVPQSSAQYPGDEFSGRKIYTTKSRIIANVTHGIVVRHLKDELEALGHKVARDRARDLFVVGVGAKTEALFEVKTDCVSTSIYTAIGQLFYHGGAGAASRLIVVIPSDGYATQSKRLSQLNIRLVTYTWIGNRPKFDGLAKSLV